MQAASSLYERAVRVVEADGKAGAAADIFRHATGNELRTRNWGAAASFQLRWYGSLAPAKPLCATLCSCSSSNCQLLSATPSNKYARFCSSDGPSCWRAVSGAGQ